MVVTVCGSAEMEGEVVILKMRRLKLNCSRVDWSRLGSREVEVPLSFAYPALYLPTLHFTMFDDFLPLVGF